MPTTKALEAKARRIAAKAGLVARKSRRFDGVNLCGGFMLTDDRGIPVGGYQYDYDAQDVIDAVRQNHL